ncbi:MAG: zinc-binding dehydrogenase [Fuerstiella sp.]
MKALVLNELKQPLSYQDQPTASPGDDEVVIRLQAAALNRRDYWITQGKYPGVETPVIPGSDGSGLVSKLGASVDANWQDRPVIINPGFCWGERQDAFSSDFQILGMPRNGTFAEEVCVPAKQIHRRPEHLDAAQAAALPLAGVTAFRALFSQGGLQSGQRVLVTGAGGGVATFAIQYAAAAGAEVWVTSSSQQKIDQAVQIGAAGGVRYTEDDWHKQLSSKAEHFHVIIDSAGGAGYARLLDLAAPGGRIVNYGATAGPPEQLELFKVFWKQLRLQGSTMGSPTDFQNMLDFVSEHKITPVIDQIVPLSSGAEAVEAMGHSPQFGKIVLQISDN